MCLHMLAFLEVTILSGMHYPFRCKLTIIIKSFRLILRLKPNMFVGNNIVFQVTVTTSYQYLTSTVSAMCDNFVIHFPIHFPRIVVYSHLIITGIWSRGVIRAWSVIPVSLVSHIHDSMRFSSVSVANKCETVFWFQFGIYSTANWNRIESNAPTKRIDIIRFQDGSNSCAGNKKQSRPS